MTTLKDAIQKAIQAHKDAQKAQQDYFVNGKEFDNTKHLQLCQADVDAKELLYDAQLMLDDYLGNNIDDSH